MSTKKQPLVIFLCEILKNAHTILSRFFLPIIWYKKSGKSLLVQNVRANRFPLFQQLVFIYLIWNYAGFL